MICRAILTLCLWWTVLPAPELAFVGTVVEDRADVKPLLPPGRNLSVAWVITEGSPVRRGDPVIGFTTSEAARVAVVRQHELALTRAEAVRQIQQASVELDGLELEAETKRLELASAGVALVRLRRPDAEAADLMRAEQRRQDLQVTALIRDLERDRTLAALGQVPAEVIPASEARLAEAEGQARMAAERCRLLAGVVDDLVVAEQELTIRRLGMELGTDQPAGQNADLRGLAKRIAAVRGRIAGEQAKGQATVARAERAWREALADAHDHTPLLELTILAADRSTIRRLAFRPAGIKGPDGCDLDRGETYTPQRGFGWLAPPVLAPPPLPSEPGARRGRGEDGLVVRGAARWRLDLPPGSCTVRLAIGDRWPWQGALVTSGKVLVAESSRTTTRQESEAEVAIGADGLVLDLGDGHAKALRAPADGVVRPQSWMSLGFRVQQTHWPLAYLSNPARYQVRALIHQDLAPLFTSHRHEATAATASTGEPSPLALAGLRRHLAVGRIALTTVDGRRLDGSVVEVDPTPQAFVQSSDPRDTVARALIIRPDAGARLRLGDTVRCRAEVPVPETATCVSAHLVAEGRSRDLVMVDGQEGQVWGLRIGDDYVIASGAPGCDLQAPIDCRPEAEPVRRWIGRVVAGAHVDVAIPTWWGRVKEQVEDGSWVKDGQVVMELYNPILEEERPRIEEDKVRAAADFRAAIENRRVAAVQVQAERGRRIVDEAAARLRMTTVAVGDPVRQAECGQALAAASAELARLRERLGRVEATPDLGPAARAKAVIAVERAVIAVRRAAIEEAATMRSKDYLHRLAVRDAWQEAVDQLARCDDAQAIANAEEQAARVSATARLRRALEGDQRERAFNSVRTVRARGEGRIFWREGWDDARRAMVRIGRDCVVWSGMVMAEILDLSDLGMEIEVDEERYREVKVGDRVRVGFTAWPGLTVEARVASVGRSFRDPSLGLAREAAHLKRVFTLTVRFSPPPEIRDLLAPGMPGWMEAAR